MRRALLLALLVVGALNAFGGGWYGLSGAPGVPTRWLEGSPFRDYVVPSLVLIVAVGGSMAVAAAAVATRSSVSRMASLFAGLVVLAWICVQVSIIGYVSWMQPVTAVAGAAILALALTLRPART